MKILLISHVFAPSIGGIETIAQILAEEFVALGHEVMVVTQTPGVAQETPYTVERQPNAKKLMSYVKWCEVCFHNNICLRMAWPLIFIKRPWVVAHHTWISRPTGKKAFQDRLKLYALRYSSSIAVSNAMAVDLPVPATVIGNAYNDGLFTEVGTVARERDLVYLGRLVSDKGVDLLLDAMFDLKNRGIRPTLSIIGTGPDAEKLKQMTRDYGLESHIELLGAKSGENLVEALNRHRILVVPSRWREPFGLVALEGIACGCVVIGSNDGGLQDAIGPCGLTFPNNNKAALADKIQFLLNTKDLHKYRNPAEKHLAQHRRKYVALEYLKVFQEALN